MRTVLLDRRTVLAVPLLAVPLLAVASGARAQTVQRDLQDGVAGLWRAADRRHLTGSWDRPGVPVRADLLPPAGEARVAAAESRMGRPMPPGLRRFFRDDTAGLHIDWQLPGRRITAPSGLALVEYAVVPPPPFGTPGPHPSPILNAGGLRVMLDDVAMLGDEWRSWRDARRAAARTATDPAERAHHRYHAAVWDRGYPVARTMGGDIVAVDAADPGERLMVLRHDGDDAPALLLGRDLPTCLAGHARLAFPGFETYRMALFADGERGRAAIEAFAPTIRAAVEPHGLFLPRACVMDADGTNAAAWRDWLGL